MGRASRTSISVVGGLEGFNSKDSNFIISINDLGKTIICKNNTNITVTIPNEDNSDIPIGFRCKVSAKGRGDVDFETEKGVLPTRDSNTYLKLNKRNSVVEIVKEDTNTWSFNRGLRAHEELYSYKKMKL